MLKKIKNIFKSIKNIQKELDIKISGKYFFEFFFNFFELFMEWTFSKNLIISYLPLKN